MDFNNLWKKSQTEQEPENIILNVKPDRRLLSKVPDKRNVRSNVDRRALKSNKNLIRHFKNYIELDRIGRRYVVDYTVIMHYQSVGIKHEILVRGVNISGSGILLEMPSELGRNLQEGLSVNLKFQIIPGSMPEGYEMKVDTEATIVRLFEQADGTMFCGVIFKDTLSKYAERKKYRYILTISSLGLCFVAGIILLMRAESIIYFKFNKALYFYSIVAATFLLTRYIFACFYRTVEIDQEYTPGVTIIIPCFNEETWIKRTILSCINQEYPIDKLEVIVIDDCSNDGSVKQIKECIENLKHTGQAYEVESRLHYFVQLKNAGKREALAKGAEMAQHEFIVFVDSDSVLDPFAVRSIVQPFKDPKVGGVSGRTDVANIYTNMLTKMQGVRYYIAFRIMKAAEAYFDAVTCLSGPLSCYRKSLVLQYKDVWLNQKFFGQKATFGDDRSMTNLILRHHRTTYQDSAVSHTIVPNTYRMFLKQQMRWKRSWLRESLIAASFMWRKEPFMVLSFYMGLIVPIAAPLIVIYNLIYVPIMHRVFPVTFIIGLILMALLMSMAQLFLRRSTTWIFGMWFCLYYEAVLLWQMPIAWFTFWKSTWGTRMTPADLAELAKKQGKQKEKPEAGARL